MQTQSPQSVSKSLHKASLISFATWFTIDKLAIELCKLSLLLDKGFVLYQQHWHSTWYSRETLAKNSSLSKCTYSFSPSRETSVSSLKMRLLSLETRITSHETRLSSLETRIASCERVVTYFWAVLYRKATRQYRDQPSCSLGEPPTLWSCDPKVWHANYYSMVLIP